jgi:hypothetical protein
MTAEANGGGLFYHSSSGGSFGADVRALQTSDSMTVEATGEVGGLYQNRVVDPRCGLCVVSSCKATSLYGKHGYCRKLSYCEDICPAYIRKALCHCS